MTLSVTRADLKEYAIQAVHGGSVDDVAVARVERGIENGLDYLSTIRRFGFQQNVCDLVTVAPYSTGTVTIPSTTTVEFSGTALPSDIVGQFLEFNGEKHWYEITTRTDNDTLVSLYVYNGNTAAGTSSQTYRIVYPLVNLPDNFGKCRALIDVESGNYLTELPYDAMWISHAERAGTGTPESFSIVPKRHDPNQWQLMLYPPPTLEQQYQMAYFRLIGWYDTSTPATSAWKRKATADTDYVDWPDKWMHVLEAAVCYMVARETMPSKAGEYKGQLDMLLYEAAQTENKSSKPLLLGRGAVNHLGTKYEF